MVNTTQQPLHNQVAIVTGGSRGIGRAIAQALAKAGATVAIVARSDKQCNETARSIRDQGGNVSAIIADVTKHNEVQQMVHHVIQELGPIDILVNNAGRHRSIGPLWLADPDEWWQDIEVNVRSTFLCMHEVLPTMIERQHGRIINISSAAGNQPRPYNTAYSSAKAAVTRLTESTAIAAKQHGVSIFAIHPGSVRTDLADHLINSEAARTWIPEYRAIYDETEVPAERAATLVVTLASGYADTLTGRFLSVYDALDIPQEE
jgi:NAD(P)-dependent dehydrogenase (short-subunit alcohol dehydrogenase family)